MSLHALLHFLLQVPVELATLPAVCFTGHHYVAVSCCRCYCRPATEENGHIVTQVLIPSESWGKWRKRTHVSHVVVVLCFNF